ncbi:MAG: tRNA (5-methylaminomethyl-2-thiouridine)(34)-methyltransferase MnmD [Chitinophagaceae bacterium]
MERKIILTEDGSHSISVPALNVTYHSVHGAIAESQHVFIQAGLLDAQILEYTGVHSILEIGFGTGLNALLSFAEAEKHKNRIYYTALEPFPLEEEKINLLNYCDLLNRPDYKPRFQKMHDCGWEEMFEISAYFRLTKHRSALADLSAPDESFNIVYFDAFAPAAQPELWTKEAFEKLYRLMTPGGILVTYCSKGEVRRAMQAAGFMVEKIPGPKGKREMVRAKKAG